MVRQSSQVMFISSAHQRNKHWTKAFCSGQKIQMKICAIEMVEREDHIKTKITNIEHETNPGVKE